MSTFTYRGIDLQMCHVTHYERRMKFDGPQFLWAEHQISVRGVYSPETTCYRVEGGDANNVVKDLGRNPAFTDQAIRDMLTQPRGKLVFTGAGPDANGAPNLFLDGLQHDSLVIVESPPPGKQGLVGEAGFLLDCNNGPRILRHNVQRILGTRLWDVELTALVCLNEAYKYYSSPAVLLSHQWTAIEDIDRDGWSTRTIRGHAIFRTDRLTQMQAKVDDFREALGHPIPDNCQRMGIQAVTHEDGNRVDYRFVDLYRASRIIAPNVTEIQAIGTMRQSTVGGQETLLGGAENIAEAAAAAEDIVAGYYTLNATGLLSRGTRSIARVARRRANLLPTSRFVVSIKVWGNEKATREDLAVTAIKIMLAKTPKAATGGTLLIGGFGLSGSVKMPPAENITFTVDLMGRFVSLTIEYILGGFCTAFNVGSVNTIDPNDPASFQDTADRLLTQLGEFLDPEIPSVATAKNTPGRSAVPGKVTRGSWLGSLVAQALGSANQLPGPAPQAPLAQDLPLDDPS